MTLRSLRALCIASLMLVGGCRQPDGPLPAETRDDPNRLYDVSRDLLNIAGGDANGRSEFADDLKVWATKGDAPWPPADELATRLSAALEGKKLSEQAAGQLARQLWIATAARELSSRQVDRLKEDVKTLLVSTGSTEPAAASVAEQLGAMQAAVTTKKRWWFQIF